MKRNNIKNTRRNNKRSNNKRSNNKRSNNKRTNKSKNTAKKRIYQKKNQLVNVLTSRFNKAVDQKLITIGIVTAPYISDKDTYITSYMAASYVKWMESAGALVIPLQFDLPKPVMLGLLKQLNGIVSVSYTHLRAHET